MTTLNIIIIKCVLELKERTGFSRPAIKKYLDANEKVR